MINKEKEKMCDIFLEKPLEKIKKEYFNEYGYNISSGQKKISDHFKEFSYTNQNNVKIKPKR